MTRETAYDEVFDAQKHYRSILDSIARPGKINPLDPVRLQPPAGLNRAAALAAFALMDGAVSFHVAGGDPGVVEYLRANTRSSPNSIERADFIFARGSASPEILEDVNCGTLAYPDGSATLVLQIEAASAAPLSGGLRLTFEGPGVKGRRDLFVRGLDPDLLLALLARNAEFPMGVDAILAFDGESGEPAVAGIPRTAQIAWVRV